MRKTPIFFVMAFLFACLSCGVPEDDKPGTVTSPLIDRTEIPGWVTNWQIPVLGAERCWILCRVTNINSNGFHAW